MRNFYDTDLDNDFIDTILKAQENKKQTKFY